MIYILDCTNLLTPKEKSLSKTDDLILALTQNTIEDLHLDRHQLEIDGWRLDLPTFDYHYKVKKLK